MAGQDEVNGKGAAMTSLKLICENKQSKGVSLLLHCTVAWTAEVYVACNGNCRM